MTACTASIVRPRTCSGRGSASEEVVDLTLGFYKRNYIEGLFLSSGIIRSPDYTMEELVRVVRTLRETHRFNGYIHLKIIPNASAELQAEAGGWADRLSTNIELPTDVSLETIRAGEEAERHPHGDGGDRRQARGEPAGGEGRGQEEADQARAGGAIDAGDRWGRMGRTMRTILKRSAGLYSGYGLKRVHYSAFSPDSGCELELPVKAPPLLREHRLYQADWLMRFCGFDADEIVSGGEDGLLDLAGRPEARLGAGASRAVSGGCDPGGARAPAAGAGAGGGVVDRILAGAPAPPARRWPTWRGWPARSTRRGRSSKRRTGRRGGSR